MARQTQILAVLFADICDSTGLYTRLGDTAARRVIEETLALISSVLPRYDGRVVKTIGDEILCVFPGTDLALLAASEMQAVVSVGRPDGQPVMIHIGMHYGTVLVEENDIYGDAVNVAAYLTAVAMPEQILTTETTEKCLSSALKSCVRPVFRVVLKGDSGESTVYQILWQGDNAHLTDVNLHSNRLIPGDSGSLVLTFGNDQIRVDQWRSSVVVGRAADCDLVVTDKFASRRHLTIKLMRTSFYLIDHSINGTFVSLESGDEVHVLRGELLLESTGRIALGRSHAEKPDEVIGFARDRRSMFRP
jgi:adenylate cyclase